MVWHVQHFAALKTHQPSHAPAASADAPREGKAYTTRPQRPLRPRRPRPPLPTPLHLRLPHPIPTTQITPHARRARIISPTAPMSLSRQSAFSILAPINNILQALPLPRLGDLRPIQIFPGLGVVDYIRERGSGDLALAAA